MLFGCGNLFKRFILDELLPFSLALNNICHSSQYTNQGCILLVLRGLKFLWVFSFVLCLFLIGQLMSLISCGPYSIEGMCLCVCVCVCVCVIGMSGRMGVE